MAESPASQAQPRFSIVTAVYNVARYLDDFIGSIESQTFPREGFEVIAVDDGSTDESLRILREWEERRPGFVTVVTQANSGQAVARNTGIELARGQWITFTDPDDVLTPEYLAEVSAFLDEHPEAVMVAANFLILNDATGRVSDTHPMRRRFRHGNRMRNLDHYPDYFFGSAPAGFFRIDDIRRGQLRFDPAIRPHFEDGHFCCRYLLSVDQPAVGFVATAQYHYRKRTDGSSTLQGSLRDPGRYTTVLREGYLDVLRRGAEQSGTRLAPEWIQNIVVYELSWYFSSQEGPAGAVTAATGAIADEFHGLLAEILERISPDLIRSFWVRALKPVWREILLHSYHPEPWHADYGHVVQLDRDQGLVRIVYRFTGAAPAEEILSGGEVVDPMHAKVRDIEYHGRILIHERLIWLSSRQSVRVRLDGRDLDLQFTVPRPNHLLEPGKIRRYLEPGMALAASEQPKREPIKPPSLTDRLILRFARTRLVRRFFGRAWVLMDRVHDAGDSGELLFRYLRKRRRGINAWFVLEGGTPDWRRLKADGYLRLVPHGSLRWKLLMANCRHLISSHADVPVMRPPALMRFMEPRWRFTFLQHGVIKDDISGWLNAKPIDLFITSTPQEFASIAGDHSPYAFTTKEVKLTGLPRFDRLHELGQRFPVDERRLVLVAPTWRHWLLPPLQSGSQRRVIPDTFFASEFAESWTALLTSTELAAACEAAGLTIGYLPHPNLQAAVQGMGLPPHVRPLTFTGEDVQELFARCAVLVTDYSSMAFNAAYIDRPVVYFQFDQERVLSGEHVGRGGYFEYERDGFGPVARSAQEAIDATVSIIRAGLRPAPTYQARIDATFVQRDGLCCERVVGEIERSARRLSPADAAVATPAPTMPADAASGS